jgi:hypothetical protein
METRSLNRLAESIVRFGKIAANPFAESGRRLLVAFFF